jgi:predicted amino acid-binding ACT domain protein
MVEPDNLVLEQLRAIRGEISKLVNEMQTMRVEMTAMRQHMTAIMTIQEHDHADIAGIKDRLDRVEKRLELADQVRGPGTH